MRHSISVFFGAELLQTAKEVKKYVLKYGVSEHIPYFNCYSWVQDGENVDISKVEQVLPSESEKLELISAAKDSCTVQLNTNRFLPDDKPAKVTQFFDRLYTEIMTVGNDVDYTQLHICLYLPLYKEEYWEQAKFIVEILNALPNRFFHIDLVGLNYDLQNVIVDNTDSDDAKLRQQRIDSSKKIIAEIVQYRQKNKNAIHHFILMQNVQEGGVSLNLKQDSFVRIVGEFSLLCVEHYRNVFGIAVSEDELQAFGLSVLQFDRYYFIDYLLHKAFIYAMEREGVTISEIDINGAFSKSETILKNRIHALSTVINRTVIPYLDNREDEEEIVARTCLELEQQLEELEKECDQLIIDEQLSIPYKRAILSALLGYDDELFKNTIFKEDALILDDMDTEAMELFIDANNSLLPEEKNDEEYTDEEKEWRAAAILSQGDEKVVNPLNEIKALRIKMQRRMGYIRDLEKEIKQLETQISNSENRKKSLIEGNFFIFGEHKYHLLPDIPEVPLEEDYVAHIPRKNAVDLRDKFTDIKDQGGQGSCVAFAVTSIFEYILKQDQQENSDLSEAFVYYKAREATGSEGEDQGSRYEHAIKSITEWGICSERLMPYIDTDFTTPPSEEAIVDASTRRVKKALNVKCTLNDIKSAIEEGYPVAISARVYDSFGQGRRGVVTMPTQDEITTAQGEDKHSRHALVVCGFDDDNELFIVRNSWGTSFGDKGYCYMPYSYITDETLVPFACIITEVTTVDSINVENVNQETRIPFDKNDSWIKYAIKNNALYREQQILNENQDHYKKLRTFYEILKETLKNPNSQIQLRNARKSKLNHNIESLEAEYQESQDEKYNQLDTFDKTTRKTAIKISLFSLGLLTIIGVLAYYIGIKIFTWEYTWYAFTAAVAAVLLMIFLYFPIRKHKRRLLEEEWDDILTTLAIRIDREKKELKRTDLKMHISGHYLTKLFQVQASIVAKHDATTSFLKNLKLWYDEDLEAVDSLDPDTQSPFVSVLKNDILDTYFENNKDTITKEISLCKQIVDFAHIIEERAINKEDLLTYKGSIKQQSTELLSRILDDFYVCNAVLNPGTYDFLAMDNELLRNLLTILDKKSKIFVCDNGSRVINPNKLLLINTPTDVDSANWNNFYPKFFSIQPNFCQLLSPYKLILFQLAELNESQLN